MLLVIFYNYHDSNSNPIVSRITSITDPDDTSRGIRIKIAETAWKMFLSNPIFGVGATNFQKYVNEYSSNFGFDWFEMLPWGPEAHNVYLQIASTMGIIGLLGLGFIIQKGFVCARKLACLGEVVLFRAIGLGAILIIVNTMILGLTCNFFLEPLGSLFFLFLALIGRSLVLSQRKQQA
jgi:O-antigen ligase